VPCYCNFLELEGNLASATLEFISVEYEQQSGDAMFIWGYDSEFYGYMQSRKWTGSWGSELPQVNLGTYITPYWFTLKADPSFTSNTATITYECFNIRFRNQS